MELQGERVVLRPLRVEDVGALVEFGAHPEVARRWPDVTAEGLIDKAEGRDEVTAFAVLLDDEVIGLAQYYEELDPDYRHAGIDLFLGAPYHGQGLGTDTVRTLARHLVRDRGHHRLTIDPAADNTPAIRSYEKVGFRRIGIMREYERGPDGTWHDGLLLDLLARELPP